MGGRAGTGQKRKYRSGLTLRRPHAAGCADRNVGEIRFVAGRTAGREIGLRRRIVVQRRSGVHRAEKFQNGNEKRR